MKVKGMKEIKLTLHERNVLLKGLDLITYGTNDTEDYSELYEKLMGDKQ